MKNVAYALALVARKSDEEGILVARKSWTGQASEDEGYSDKQSRDIARFWSLRTELITDSPYRGVGILCST